MTGPEVSVFALCDGVRAVALDPAQDFKRVGDGDTGPNTGGMGAYSPLPWLEPGFADDVIKRFVQPTLDELRRRGIDYRGVALHRADGHRRGPEAASSTTSASATPTARSCSCASPPTSPHCSLRCRRASCDHEPVLRRRRRGARRRGRRGLPHRRAHRRRDPGARRRPVGRGRRRAVRRRGRGRTRRAGDRRRPGPRGGRPGPRPRPPPGSAPTTPSVVLDWPGPTIEPTSLIIHSREGTSR